MFNILSFFYYSHVYFLHEKSCHDDDDTATRSRSIEWCGEQLPSGTVLKGSMFDVECYGGSFGTRVRQHRRYMFMSAGTRSESIPRRYRTVCDTRSHLDPDYETLTHVKFLDTADQSPAAVPFHKPLEMYHTIPYPSIISSPFELFWLSVL